MGDEISILKMYQGVYQQGKTVDVLSAQSNRRVYKRIGSGGLKQAKTTGTVVRVYEKQVKGYVYQLEANNSCRVQLPKDEKQSLGLTQPYLVLQLYLPSGKAFNLELTISDNVKANDTRDYCRLDAGSYSPQRSKNW